jgi:predicted nucleic acid-binding protein
MRILCDTNVLARAATRPGGPAQEVVRRLLESQNHVLVVTPFLLDELTRVLGYTRVRLRSIATAEEIAQFLDDLERACELVDAPTAGLPSVPGDPDDDPVLAGAVSGRVEVLCTRDRHFHKSEVVALCASFQIRILDDVALLTELRQAESTP